MKPDKDLPVLPLIVTDINQQGQGIGHLENGLTVFVEGGVPGDRLEVRLLQKKARYAVAKIVAIDEASNMRGDSDCPWYPRCGGCQFRHIRYDAQLQIKKKLVTDALERIGGVEDAQQRVRDTLGMQEPCRYRNKAQFKVSRDGIGFYKKNSHAVVAIDDCFNQPESCRRVIAACRKLLKDGLMSLYDERRHRGILRGVVQRSNQQGQEMVTLVVTAFDAGIADALIDIFKEALPQLVSLNININPKRGNAVMGKETQCIWGEPRMAESLGGLAFQISPRSFFQVNTKQTEILYSLVGQLAKLDGTQTVFDLFCGTGTIGLFLARGAKKVIGVETIPEAVEDARGNAAANCITNAEFICGKAEKVMDDLVGQGILPEVAVVDPPRKGIDAHIISLLASHKVPSIIYVSCNPATLARDIAGFTALGYGLGPVQPVDLFPFTGHVETVCLMSRVEGK
jgi:23S rRNA (uracil1939-C5)-methyltransferase